MTQTQLNKLSKKDLITKYLEVQPSPKLQQANKSLRANNTKLTQQLQENKEAIDNLKASRNSLVEKTAKAHHLVNQLDQLTTSNGKPKGIFSWFPFIWTNRKKILDIVQKLIALFTNKPPNTVLSDI